MLIPKFWQVWKTVGGPALQKRDSRMSGLTKQEAKLVDQKGVGIRQDEANVSGSIKKGEVVVQVAFLRKESC